MDGDRCLKCGQCCRYVIRDGNKFIKTGIPCIYLTKDNLCSIYEHRPNTCHTIDIMREQGMFDMLPDTCGYKRR
jgi:Fe-S-cluster containining protein